MIRIINLFPSDADRNQFKETLATLHRSKEADIDSYSQSLTWSEFADRLKNGCDFHSCEKDRESEGSARANQYLLMIDDIDMFQMVGNIAIYSTKEGGLTSTLNGHQLMACCVKSVQSSEPVISNIGEILPKITSSSAIPPEQQLHQSGIISLIVYGKQPSEVRMQLPNMNFSSTYFDTDSIALSQRHRNGPYDDENEEPLLSEYLKYRYFHLFSPHLTRALIVFISLFRADLLLVTNPLQTGHSTAVHGTITINYQSISQILSKNGRTKQVLQYKATENAVLCHIVDYSQQS